MIYLYINWHVSPEIFRTGEFAIRWYGVLFALAFLCGYSIMSRMVKKEGISQEIPDVLLMYMFAGTVIGARLGHCLFYEPEVYLAHPIEIFKIWEGGLASHGGAIGILIALYIFARRNKFSYLWTLDRVVILSALSGFFIRMGNLMNSEIYGKISSLPWAFQFYDISRILKDDVITVEYLKVDGLRHPTQIYEALAYLLIFVVLLLYYLKKDGKPEKGVIFGAFLISLFTVRFFVEFLKERQVNFEKSMFLDMGQLLSLPFIITGIVILFLKLNKQKSSKTA